MSDGVSSMSRDIVEVLPSEIWQRCIAQACHGDRYVAILLKLTMVSRRWCQLLTGTPILWSNIHVNDTDEDSFATIAVFLHLSCNVQLSLIIWVPLSERWDTIYPIILPHRDRIRAITLRTKSQFHSATCALKPTINDAELQQNLQRVFVTLRHPTSVERLDVIPDHPVRMGSIWVPPNIASTGNWLLPLRPLQPPSHLSSRLRHLSISTVDLVDFFPYLSAFEHLQTLHLHSDGQEYPHQSSSPKKKITGVVLLHLPFLTTLRYHGRLYWASTQLLGAVAQTIQDLELHIGIQDVEEAILSLNTSKSLRRFSLILENNIDDNGKRRLPKINVPKWRLIRLQEFRCKMKSLETDQAARNLDSDQLWQLFHTIFPRLYTLVWNLPIGPRALLISLIRQKQLRRFESNVVSAPFSRQPTTFVFNTLESLHVRDAQMLQGVAITNLLNFSATFQDDFKFPAGFTFALLHSLDLTISDRVTTPCDIKSGDFPVLQVLSLTFLGPSCHFQALNLPSLTEITISTGSPTFPQPMEFCASLIAQPRNCPRLEQVILDSFLEWDILCLLLCRRNSLQDKPVSPVKRLGLRFLPPKFRPMFVSLLASRQISSFPSLLILMTRLSIQAARSRLLDQEIIGCFCCVQLGLADCNEPLHASRLPEEYRTSQEKGHVSNVIEPLGLFPLYDRDIVGPVIPKISAYENTWMEGRRKRAKDWRSAAYEWSKLHHRTPVCHKQHCSPIVMVTQYDMEESEVQAYTSLLALYSLVEYDGFCDLIPSLIELLQDKDHKVQSDAAATYAKLAEHVELRGSIRPAIPGLINLLKDRHLEVQSATASVLVKLAQHPEFHDVMRPTIPIFTDWLTDPDHHFRLPAASALARLAEHAEFHEAIHAAVLRLLGLLRVERSNDRLAAVSALASLAEHAEFHDVIRPTIPIFTDWLTGSDHHVRLAAASSLVRLAEHAEFHEAIHAAVPRLMGLLQGQHLLGQISTIYVLSKLAQHIEFHDALRPAIPRFKDLLTSPYRLVPSGAAFALAKLESKASDTDTRE